MTSARCGWCPDLSDSSTLESLEGGPTGSNTLAAAFLMAMLEDRVEGRREHDCWEQRALAASARPRLLDSLNHHRVLRRVYHSTFSWFSLRRLLRKSTRWQKMRIYSLCVVQGEVQRETGMKGNLYFTMMHIKFGAGWRLLLPSSELRN